MEERSKDRRRNRRCNFSILILHLLENFFPCRHFIEAWFYWEEIGAIRVSRFSFVICQTSFCRGKNSFLSKFYSEPGSGIREEFRSESRAESRLGFQLLIPDFGKNFTRDSRGISLEISREFCSRSDSRIERISFDSLLFDSCSAIFEEFTTKPPLQNLLSILCQKYFV